MFAWTELWGSIAPQPNWSYFCFVILICCMICAFSCSSTLFNFASSEPIRWDYYTLLYAHICPIINRSIEIERFPDSSAGKIDDLLLKCTLFVCVSNSTTLDSRGKIGKRRSLQSIFYLNLSAASILDSFTLGLLDNWLILRLLPLLHLCDCKRWKNRYR